MRRSQFVLDLLRPEGKLYYWYQQRDVPYISMKKKKQTSALNFNIKLDRLSTQGEEMNNFGCEINDLFHTKFYVATRCNFQFENS